MDLEAVDEKTAFKMGFAAYCADNNLSKEAAAALLKQAAGIPPWLLTGLRQGGRNLWSILKTTGAGAAFAAPYAAIEGGKLVANMAQPVAGIAAGVPIAASLAAGGGLGWGAAKLNEPTTTPEDIQAQELKDTYDQYSKRLKARRAYQQYRAARDVA
jgi:hypothetical protein